MNDGANARRPIARRVLVVRNHPSTSSGLVALVSVAFVVIGLVLVVRAAVGASDAFGALAQGAIGFVMIGLSGFALYQWVASGRERVQLIVDGDQLVVELGRTRRVVHRLDEVRGAHVHEEGPSGHVVYTTCLHVAKGAPLLFDERPHWLRKESEQTWPRRHYEATAETINRFLSAPSR